LIDLGELAIDLLDRRLHRAAAPRRRGDHASHRLLAQRGNARPLALELGDPLRHRHTEHRALDHGRGDGQRRRRLGRDPRRQPPECVAELVDLVGGLVRLGDQLGIGDRAIAQRLAGQPFESLPPLCQERDQLLPDPVAEDLGGDARPLGRAFDRGDAVGDVRKHALGRARIARRIRKRHAEPAKGLLGRSLARRRLGDPARQRGEPALQVLVAKACRSLHLI
jgi:hypothetical protein